MKTTENLKTDNWYYACAFSGGKRFGVKYTVIFDDSKDGAMIKAKQHFENLGYVGAITLYRKNYIVDARNKVADGDYIE